MRKGIRQLEVNVWRPRLACGTVAGMDAPSPPTASTPRGLLANPAFRLLFAAAAVSKLGTQVSYLALPLVALDALHASPGQVGLLGALGPVAFLLIGLPAGVWVDRSRHRPIMITADLVRAALLASIPLAWALHALTLPQLYAVVLATGVGTVFFDVASQSNLPAVVTRERLVAANAALVTLDGSSSVAGRGLGGVLVQVLGAPMAVVTDAVSYLASAACLLGIRGHDRAATSPVAPRALLVEVWEGLRFVVGHRMLRPVAVKGALGNLGFQMAVTMMPVVFLGAHLSAGALGVFLACSGLGSLIGASVAPRLAARLGLGPSVWRVGLLVAPMAFVIPLVGRGAILWMAAFRWSATAVKTGFDNVVLVAFRQHVTPNAMLGRMNATMRVVLFGALALGSLASGVIGATLGPHAALWAGSALLAVSWLPVYCSPLRGVRAVTELPTPTEAQPSDTTPA